MKIFVALIHWTAAELADIATTIASCCDGHTILHLSQVLEYNITLSPQEIEAKNQYDKEKFVNKMLLDCDVQSKVTRLAKLLFEAKGFAKTVNERSALESLAYKLQPQRQD